MLRELRHTGLVVSDLERSLQLYRDTLGFEVVRTNDTDSEFFGRLLNVPGAHLLIAFLQPPGGGHLIELIQYASPAGDKMEWQSNSVGAAHLAIEVDDLDAALPRLREKGVSVPGEVMTVAEGQRAGVKVAYARDPDGIFLELFGPPPGS
jgi:catechol 2,3-dioxygenase-like lactoylglutathione lyase family enzyme